MRWNRQQDEKEKEKEERKINTTFRLEGRGQKKARKNC